MARRHLLLAALLLIAPALPACAAGGGAEPGAGSVTDPDAPQAVLESLEARLLEGEVLRVVAHLEAQGAVEAVVDGTWWIAADGRARIDVEGVFMGEAFTRRLVCDGRLLALGPPDALRVEAAPPALPEALVLGATRMGLLHNVAVLVQGRGPDGADGTVDGWARMVDLSLEEGPGGRRLLGAVVVGGEPAGEATLHLDADGLPALRQQVVHFPEGNMHVLERYDVMELLPTASEALFEVPRDGAGG